MYPRPAKLHHIVSGLFTRAIAYAHVKPKQERRAGCRLLIDRTASRSASSLNGLSDSVVCRRRFSPRWLLAPAAPPLGGRAADRSVDASHASPAPSPAALARPDRPSNAAETELGDCDNRLALARRSFRAPSSRRSFHVPDSLFHWFLHLCARAADQHKARARAEQRRSGRPRRWMVLDGKARKTYALSVRPGSCRAMSAHFEPRSS